MKKRHFLWIIGIFLIILSGSRFLWMHAFYASSDLSIKNGQLNLTDWQAQEDDVLLLDGEWEFYPSQWLIDHEAKSNIDEANRRLIQVPGKWDDVLNEEQSTPYGYGSYRLRIYVDPKKQINYSIHLPSVRSSSEVYVNGRFLGGSGEIGQSTDTYTAKNLPYSTTFTADENGVIDLVVQAANFKDVRQSGIIRSIKFGSEEAISKNYNLSLSMQIIASVIFFIHAIYALILFFLGNHDKRLIYFSLLLFCFTLMNLLSNDEKIFHLLFYIGYDWDFRLANAIIPITCSALLQCIDYHKVPYWHKIHPFYSIINLGVAILTLFLSPAQIIMLFPLYYLLAGIAAIVGIIAIIRTIYRDITENILLLLSIVAAIHHFTWAVYWRETGISAVHYPFDLIIAIGLFASIWFKEYFSMHAETEKLALKLQKMNAYKDQFLANTAHEFKNPLHGMINMSQSVLRREKQQLRNKSIHELEMILTVGRRMSLLLNDLLDAAQLKEGQPRLQKKRITLQPIVNGVIDMLQFTIEGKPVKIVNQVPDDFPFVIADENRIIQVIYNLLHNAIKFTEEGNVYIEAALKDERAFISISDTGSGMDKAFLKRLFEPYEQASDERMNEGGFGLGLSISKQLVELHGGQLEASSTPGEGSTFTFSLELDLLDSHHKLESDSPAKVQSSASQETMAKDFPEPSTALPDEEVSAASETTQLPEIARERLPILIVDDDPINLQVIQSLLSGEQYEITTVMSGKEALDNLGKKEWNLVISDVMMPQMSGYELTKMIRKRYSLTELPILLLTARNDPRDLQAGFIAGANDYVTKPVEMLELRARVRALATVKTAVREQLQLESAWLQAQIQPHFLFNTLNSIIALSTMDLDKMNDLLHELSDFLRSKFRFQDIDKLIPIEEELNIVRSYLNIEKVRYENRLQVEWKTDAVQDVKIPFLSIQPLVENAIKHGIMKRINGGKIIISISVHNGYAAISVEDNGVGMDENQLQALLERKRSSQTGVGLVNTNQRLIHHFGKGLQIKSTPTQGTAVSFTVNI